MFRDNHITNNVPVNPPGPRGYPLLGILPMLVRNPLQFLVDVGPRYGDVIDLKVGPQRFYLLNHPNHFKHVLQDNCRNYRKDTMKVKNLLGEGLITSDGDFWRRQRRLMQPAFHHQRFEAMATKMTDVGVELIERWQPYAAGGAPLNLTAEMMRLAQQVIGGTMFGSSIGEQSERIYHAFDVALKHLSSTLWLGGLPDQLVPGRRQFAQAVQSLDDFIYRIIEERRQSGDDPGDLLSMLLEARDADTGEGMTNKQLRDEVMTMFFAGHETSATTMVWTWHMLATHPHVERRLHEELEQVLGGRTPTFQDLPQLDYTRMVIEEVLRFYPPAWALFRTPRTDDMIGGYHIPAGSMVLLCPYAMHRSPDFWEEPERFDPERFLPERSAARPNFAYVPFAGGPRQCIGKHFAMMEMQLMIAMVAQRYRLHSVPGQQVEPHIAITLRPRQAIQMQLSPRTPTA